MYLSIGQAMNEINSLRAELAEAKADYQMLKETSVSVTDHELLFAEHKRCVAILKTLVDRISNYVETDLYDLDTILNDS